MNIHDRHPRRWLDEPVTDRRGNIYRYRVAFFCYGAALGCFIGALLIWVSA